MTLCHSQRKKVDCNKSVQIKCLPCFLAGTGLQLTKFPTSLAMSQCQGPYTDLLSFLGNDKQWGNFLTCYLCSVVGSCHFGISHGQDSLSLSGCSHPALWLSTNHINFSLISLFIFMHFSSLSHQLDSFKLFLKLSKVAACFALWGSPFQPSTVPHNKGILSQAFSCSSCNKALVSAFYFMHTVPDLAAIMNSSCSILSRSLDTSPLS